MMCTPERRANSVARYGFLHDSAGRIMRARRIVEALQAIGGCDLSRSKVLDVGCSAGTMTRAVGAYSRLIVGVDVDPEAVAYAHQHAIASEEAVFAAAAGEALPFADAAFDVVICNHVYEHAHDAGALMREIARVLKPEGWCYFAGGHTLQLIEPHFRLPLLATMPRSIADRYLRWSGRGEQYDIEFVPPWRIKHLFRAFSSARFISPAMLHEWDRYDLVPPWWPKRLRVRLPRPVASAAAWLAPTYIWLLRR